MVDDPDSWWLSERAHAGREHFDEEHARRYDAKMDAQAAAEIRVLRDMGVLRPESSVVDLGAGSGQFALAVAELCNRVVAVDISPVMLGQLRKKLEASQLSNVETIDAGFLSYEHAGEAADVVYSRYALHHLPDFWQAIALDRIAGMLRPGGVFRCQMSSTASNRLTPSSASKRGSRRRWQATSRLAGHGLNSPNTCATSIRRSPGCWSR
jgi:ubiquinone/menaquinone biosynthesis C-methylase UbiE